MKASFLLLPILGMIAVKLVTGKIDRVAVANVVSDKQQPAIAGKIAGRRRIGGKLFTTSSLLPNHNISNFVFSCVVKTAS